MASGNNPYRLRMWCLRQIGFDTYAEYLDSDLWEKIRGRVWKRDGGKCRACGRPGRQVHHRSYSVEILLGLDLKPLWLLCGRCHSGAERGPGKKKRPLAETNLLLDRKLRQSREVVVEKDSRWPLSA